MQQTGTAPRRPPWNRAERDRLLGAPPGQFCREMLQHVSRTFALTLPELPAPLDQWAGCAYLLCRIADTIEDSPDLDADQRGAGFSALGTLLDSPDDAGGTAVACTWRDLPQDRPDYVLLARWDAVLALYQPIPPPARQAVSECVLEMIEGMRELPPARAGGEPAVLHRTLDDLHRYCYYVAGVVGIMLTRLFRLHVTGAPSRLDRRLWRRAVDFGIGLQMTNVLKDHPTDLLAGRCYIPAEAAARCGLPDAAVLDTPLPAPIRDALLADAVRHLDTAIEYTLSWPAAQRGLRLFCLLPILFAVRTLGVLSGGQDLDATPGSLKISGADVNEVIHRSRALCENDAAVRQWYHTERAALGGLAGGAPASAAGSEHAPSA